MADLCIYRAVDLTTNKSRVVHRNFLLPVNLLPLGDAEEDTVLSTLSEDNYVAVRATKRDPLKEIGSESDDQRTTVRVLPSRSQENGDDEMMEASESTLREQGTINHSDTMNNNESQLAFQSKHSDIETSEESHSDV